MATPTYTPIASITLGSSASSVTFSSIPQDYRDLVLVIRTISASAANQFLRINGDTGSNYSYVVMQGNGSSSSSASGTDSSALLAQTSKTHNLSITQLMDYSATDKHTTILSRQNDGPTDNVAAVAIRWSNSSAVTSLEIRTTINSYSSGTTFSLFGIAS